MSRLIDADELLQEIEESANAVEVQIHLGKCNEDVAKGMLSGLALVRENILRKKTAYDVDKVVAELEEFKMVTWSELLEEEIEVINLDRVKAIIRKGGVEDAESI